MQTAPIAAALRHACLTELEALKPGNVHRYASGHSMTVADFEASAEAVAEVFAVPGLSVGARILQAVERTRAAVGCNTNLGIVLLCAPLAEAAARGGKLRPSLAAVLQALDVEDAELAFRAIRLAEPAGLSTSEAHDVREPAQVGLRSAMAAAAGRDRIARQYTNGFADVFDPGVAGLRERMAKDWSEAWAAAGLYLDFVADTADTHVERKHGPDAAEALCRRARPIAEALRQAGDPSAMTSRLLAFDGELKREGLNPGTSADLTVASLFALRLEEEMALEARS